MPMKRRPWRWRTASASTAKAAVEPVPRPDDHAVGHQLDRGLGRLALQRVAIRCIAAHDFASPTVADLRMAAMAAA